MKKEMTFEVAKIKIEQIIQKMESGNLPLEESVKQFEEAAELVKYCQKLLDEYKGKIETILSDSNKEEGDEYNE